ncbi:MAG: regulatory protein RecX [Tetrasphaera sp.]
MSPATSGPDLDALRAAVARIEAGGSPHRPPGPPPDLTQSGGGHQVGPALQRDRAVRGDDGDEPDGGGARDGARDPHAFAREIVLRQLANSPKTRAQLRAKLAERGCDPGVAEDVLARMGEVGLVNDAAYAETYVRSKQLTRGLSKQALAHELRGKGVADEIAAAALEEIDDVHEAERARDLVRGRLPRMHGLDREVTLRRLVAMLARKGYPSGLATRVVLEEVDATAEQRRD